MLVRLIAWPIAMIIWAIGGFYVWIPALVIGGAFYIGSVLSAALDLDLHMKKAEEVFQEIVHAYPHGFAKINQALLGRKGGSESESENETPFGCIAFLVVAAICLVVATLFWWIAVALSLEIFDSY